MQILVTGHLQMTFGGIWAKKYVFGFRAVLTHKKYKFWSLETSKWIWGHLEQNTFFYSFWSVLASFGPQKMYNFWNWTPPHDVWGHLEQNNCFANFCIFEPLNRHFDPPNMQMFANFGHGRPTYDFWGHVGQNDSLLPPLCKI